MIMEKKNTKDYSKKILTIPNALSLFRLLLIPLFVWLYVAKDDMIMTTVVLVLSGLTDIADGYIARTYNMVSDFGKALDPVADKLTQLAMLFCLMYHFPHMFIPLVLLAIKELTTAITGSITIYKTKTVMGAVWHGKLTTFALYTMMVIHLLWGNIPPVVSDTLIGICVGIMMLSFVLYTIRNIKAINAAKKSKKSKKSNESCAKAEAKA